MGRWNAAVFWLYRHKGDLQLLITAGTLVGPRDRYLTEFLTFPKSRRAIPEQTLYGLLRVWLVQYLSHKCIK